MRALLLALVLAAAHAAAQPADAIERFCGGGVAGGGSGLRLLPDGSAFALRRARAGAPLEAVPVTRQGGPMPRSSRCSRPRASSGSPPPRPAT